MTNLSVDIGGDDSDLQKALTRIEASFEKMASAGVSAIEKLVKSAEADLPKLEQAAEKAGVQGGNALQKGFQRAWDKIGEGSLRAGKSMSLFLTLPLLAIGKHAVQVAANFEQSMQILQASSGASGEQMKQLSKLADDLGRDLTIPGASASTAALAMTELVKSGVSVKDTMAAAHPTLLLAAAGMMSNEEAAHVVGLALNQFGLDGTQAARVANLLAGAGKNVSGGVKGMSDAIVQAGTAFRTLGQPVGDAVTSIALLARNGIIGEQAGTNLKTALLRLAAASKDAKTPAHELAQSLFNLSTGQMKPMSEVVQILHDRLGSLSPRQQAIIGGALGGVRAFQALAIMSRYTGSQFKDLEKELNKTGNLEIEAAARTNGFTGSMKQLQSAIDTALKSAITPFLPMLTNLAKKAGDAAVAFSNWSGFAQATAVTLVTVVAATGPVLIGISKIKQALVVLGITETATAAATRALWLSFLGPIGAVVAAVALAVVAWTENWGHIQEFTFAVWDTLVNLFTNGTGAIETIWGALCDFLQGRWISGSEALVDLAKRTGQDFVNNYVDEVVKMKDKEAKALSDADRARKAALAAANPPVNDNLHPGKNDPNLDLGGGKKKLSDYEKQLQQYTDALSTSVIKLASARKGENEATQEVRASYNLLTTAQQNALIASDAHLKKVNDLITEHKKYKDTVHETELMIAALGKSGGKSIAELTKEFPHATAAQVAFLNRLKQTLTETERVRDRAISAARSNEAAMLASEAYSPIKGTTLHSDVVKFHTPTEIAAMEQYGLHLDKLTKAQLDETGTVMQRKLVGEQGLLIYNQQIEREHDLALAYVRSRIALKDDVRELQAQATGSAVARFALEKYHVVLAAVDSQTKKNILSDYRYTELMKAKDSLAASMQGVFEHAFTNISGGLKGLFTNILSGVDDLLTQIAAKFVAAKLVDLLFSLFPGGTGFLSSLMAGGTPGAPAAKALGGTVAPGSSYIVGENGPEMFVPSGSGRIVPAHQTKQMVQGGVVQHITIITKDAQSFQQSRSTSAATIAHLADAARRRNGG